LRSITSGLAATFFLAIAGATPITLTFSGTASGSVNGTSFSNDAFSINFFSDTTDVCQIGNMVYSSCPQTGDVGDWTTPNPTDNSFTLGSFATSTDPGELDGLSALIGAAVFLNTTTNNVGIWFFNTSDWLTTASGQYTSGYGLVNNLSVSDVQSYGNVQLGSVAMNSTVGAIDFSSVSGVSFTEALGTPSSPTPSTPLPTPTPTVIPSAATAPEPSTLTLLAIGILGLTLGKLRRPAQRS